MQAIIVLAIIIGLLLSFGVYLDIRADYERHKKKTKSYEENYTKMKWSMVKQLYQVDKNKWSFEPHTMELCYRYPNPDSKPYFEWYKEIYILLSFSDFIRLEIAHCKYQVEQKVKKENRQKQTSRENLKTILESAQRDIDKLKQEADRDIREASKRSAEIIERMVK